MSTFDEHAVMERVRDGDVTAFEFLVQHFWRELILYALSLTQDSDRAEDISQHAFARLWSSRRDWTRRGSVRVWLFRTARNEFVSRHRKRKVREAWASRPEARRPQPDPTPLVEAQRSELRTAIRRAVADLSPRRREAFTLVHIQGLSYREAAEVMAVRQQTVANYLQAAVADLRSALSDHDPADG
jgi:RNA polymerase sigma-70 factor, ECF subfamily